MDYEKIGDIYTDLALEAREIAIERGNQESTGLDTKTEQDKNVQITRVHVQTEAAGRMIGKVPGYYVTLEAPDLRNRDRDRLEEIALTLAKEIEGFITRLQLSDSAACLVVGLGNWDATPDALGPKVVNQILVTRHLKNTNLPQQGGLRPVCALAPGVLGTTGLETGEIILGLVQRIKPQFVIAVDALAARGTGRMGATIQVADTGIHPGSGLGNKRVGITPDTLGIPVIAIGAPTVVGAATIIQDAFGELTKITPGLVNPQINRTDLISRVLSPYLGSLIVTPKEIDIMVKDLAMVIGSALNIALHPGVSPDEVFRYLS